MLFQNKSTIFAASMVKRKEKVMATLTIQVPNTQVGWVEQMAISMGWAFREEDSPIAESVDDAIGLTPSMRRQINKARKESKQGETAVCRNRTEMQQYFDSL